MKAAEARQGATPTEINSPRWALVGHDGGHEYVTGDRACGVAVGAVPDAARLSFLWPARQALRACPEAYRALVYVPLTTAERRLAPDADEVVLATRIWTAAWLARMSRQTSAAALADHYRLEARELRAMRKTRANVAEAADYEALAREYEGYAADEATRPRPVAPDAPYTLTDVGALLDTEFDPLVFLTKGEIQLAAGAYLLAGKPKHGKSWLAMGLAISVCTGEEYLQTTPAEKGQAIYLACDDSSERRFKDRVQAIGPQGKLAGQMGLVTKWAPEALSTIEVLDGIAGSYPRLRVAVIDTLSAFRKSLRNDSPYQQEYDELKALNDWAHTRGVVLIVVHHLRKGAVDPNDPFESISGTLGLQGAVDGMMVLSRTDDRDDDGTYARKLAGFWLRGRDIEGELSLGLELKDGRWRIDGTAADVFNAGTQRLITQLLREAGGRWMTSKELHASGAFDCKAPSVQKAASRMAAKGLIESHRGALEGRSGGGGGFRIAPGGT